MGLVSFMRSIALFMLVVSIFDTVTVSVLIGTGVQVYDWVYFAPAPLANSFYQSVQKAAYTASHTPLGLNVFAYFFLFVIPTGLFAAANLIYGLFAGMPIMISNLLQVAGAPLNVVLGLTALAIIFQALADIWLIDVLIAYIVGRTPLLSMIFGE